MQSATVHISTSTHDELRDLASRLGRPMRIILEEAFALYRGRFEPAVSESSSATASDELDDDPNVIAFENLDRSFREEHLGEYVAICEGEIVGIAPEKEEVLDIIESIATSQSCFIKQIVSQEMPASLGCVSSRS